MLPRILGALLCDQTLNGPAIEGMHLDVGIYTFILFVHEKEKNVYLESKCEFKGKSVCIGDMKVIIIIPLMISIAWYNKIPLCSIFCQWLYIPGSFQSVSVLLYLYSCVSVLLDVLICSVCCIAQKDSA